MALPPFDGGQVKTLAVLALCALLAIVPPALALLEVVR